LGGQILVLLTGLLYFLFEAMKHVNGIFNFAHLHDSKGTVRLFDANLFCTCTHIIKRLPVIWVVTALHFAKLISSGPPRIFGKNSVNAQVFER